MKMRLLLSILVFLVAANVLPPHGKKAAGGQAHAADSGPAAGKAKGPGGMSEAEKAAKRAAKQKDVDALEGNKTKGWTAALNDLALLEYEHLAQLAGTKEAEHAAGAKKHVSGGKSAYEVEPAPLNAHEPELKAVGPAEHPAGGRAKRAVTCTDYAFDIRQQWPQCASIISNVRDQSLCGSCWAVSAAAAFTDRMCIAYAKAGYVYADANYNYNSAAEVMGCSGGAPSGDACGGGYMDAPWKWFVSNGVVSGHNYTYGGCKPYPFPTTNQAMGSYSFAATPTCPSSCSNGAYPYPYSGDQYYASDYHYLYNSPGNAGWEQTMKNEIAANGSITASFMVYQDFYSYSSGVYKYTSGSAVGGHAIRLIGYGTVNCTDGTSTKYWLAANSWNYNWGMGGLFKIQRGVDMVGIESRGMAYGTSLV